MNTQALKTHCKRGHAFDEANTHWDSRGYRVCRACDKEWRRHKRAKVRETEPPGETAHATHEDCGKNCPCCLSVRFWARVDESGECWAWRGRTDSQGYGEIRVQNRLRKAHRVAYELMVGPIPEGLHLDHLCRNVRCVRSDHLEPVTSKVNTLRGVSPSAMNATKTHCPQGHSYDEKNTYVTPQGGRNCRACRRLRAPRRAVASGE